MSRTSSSLIILQLVPVLIGALQHPGFAQPLSPEESYTCQLAIEETYWAQRIWPESNPGPKPPLTEVISTADLVKKAEEGALLTFALGDLYQHFIRPEDLQAEIDRMARESRSPEALAELFAALNNDPYLIAECLARPALARRLLRARFARDQTIHGPLKSTIQQTLMGANSTGELGFGPGRVGTMVEDETRFWVRSASELSDADLEPTVENWPKASFEAWWTETRSNFPAAQPFDRKKVELHFPRTSNAERCEDDTWESDTVVERNNHVAVWTGSEIIVWGGSYADQWTSLNNGYRYRPATGEILPIADGLGYRCEAQGVWTGTEMLVVGCGQTGARYDPVADTWSPMNGGPPDPTRREETIVWTGTELLMWGGTVGQPIATGGRYDPVLNSWSPMATVNAPSARRFHTAVWTGNEMVIWGGRTQNGFDCQHLNVVTETGGRYNPTNDTWAATSLVGAPTKRSRHVAAWVGGRMVVTAGDNGPIQFHL